MLKTIYRKAVPNSSRKIIWKYIIKHFLGGRIFYFPDYPRNIKNFLQIKIFGKRYNYYAGNEQIVTTTNTGQIIVVKRDDNSISPSLILYGEWEKEITKYAEKFIKTYECPTIFDIGANVGWYGLILSRFCESSEIHYFEANKSLIECIRRTTIINGLSHRSRINNNAVSDVTGEKLKLKVINHLQGSSTIEELDMNQENTFFDDLKKPTLIEVPSITIDEYSNLGNVKKIDFLKIDVEGHEEKVINGAIRMIKSSKDMTLLMEWNTNRYSDQIIKNLVDFEILILINGKQVINCKDLHKSCTSVNEFETSLKEITNYKHSHFDLIFTSKKIFSLSNIRTR